MEQLIQLLTNYSLADIFVLLMLLGAAATGCVTIYKKIIAFLEDYRIKRNRIDDKDKDLHDQLDSINSEIDNIKSNIEELQSKLSKLEKSQQAIQTDLNRYNKITSKNAVYKLANELIAKKWASQTEYASLQDLSDIYLKTGDTKYVIPNIIQRALSVPVLTDDEIEAKMAKK